MKKYQIRIWDPHFLPPDCCLGSRGLTVVYRQNGNIILQDMAAYRRSLRRGGHMLLSGFYEADVPAITKAAEELGLSLQAHLQREGWSCLDFCDTRTPRS